MTKEEILDKYYLLTESQEEFDKVLEIFDEYKGVLNSKHYFNFKSNTYLFFNKGCLLIRHWDSSDNKKNFITFDKLLDLLDETNIVDKLINVPILVETRDEWDDVISYFIENNIEINFSVGDFEPAYYLVYDSMAEFIEYTEFITESEDYYKEPITYNEFCKIVSKISEEELTKDKLKYIVNKYLIRNNDVNNSYSDLLGFVNEINEKFNLKVL